jgi:Leucine-rich repeat (LRR) protein
MKNLLFPLVVALLMGGCGGLDDSQGNLEEESFNPSLMIKCVACEQGISKQAKACPGCGHPNPAFIAAEKEAVKLAEEQILKGQGGSEALAKILKAKENGTTKLYLDGNGISDLTPLSGLTELVALSLHDNQINDLGPLAELTNLKELQLYGNQIKDLTPLAGLTNLKMLFLSKNHIMDVTPLAGLTNLEELNLGKNQIIAVTPLAGLTNLNELRLDGNVTTVAQKAMLRKALPKCKITF